jgi:hypothetical protein
MTPTAGIHSPGLPDGVTHVERPYDQGDIYVHGRLYGWYHRNNRRWTLYVPGRGVHAATSREDAIETLVGLAAAVAERTRDTKGEAGS